MEVPTASYLQRLNMVILYNDHTTQLRASHGVIQSPFGNLQMERGERVPVLYFFNEPQFGQLKQNQLLQELLLNENWIIFAPVSQQNVITTALRELMGREIKIMRSRLHQRQRRNWVKVLEQQLQPLISYRSRLRFHFIKILLPSDETKSDEGPTIYSGNIQWRRPLLFISIILFIFGMVYFAESRLQMLSIWTNRPLQILLNKDEPELEWRKPFVSKISNYIPNEKFTIRLSSLTALFNRIERDRLSIGLGLFPQTLHNMQIYGWSEPYLLSGLVIVRKISPDSLQPLSFANLPQFFTKIGYRIYRSDKTLEERLQNSIGMKGIVLEQAPALTLFRRLRNKEIDCMALDQRTIRALRRSWSTSYQPQLIELIPGKQMTMEMAQILRGLRLFIRKDRATASDLKMLEGKVGLITLATDYDTAALANRGLDTTRVQLSKSARPEEMLNQLKNAELNALLIPAIIFEKFASQHSTLRVVCPLLTREYYAIAFHPSRMDLKREIDRALAIIAYQSERNSELAAIFKDIQNASGDRIIDWFPVVK